MSTVTPTHDVTPPTPPDSPTYVPLDPLLPPNTTLAFIQSLRASNIAAGKDPLQLAIVVPPPDPASDFPVLLYNKEKRTMKVAANKEEEDKLAKEGFQKEPFPPPDPDALTQEEVKQLEALLAKAAKALAKLGELSEKEEKEPAGKSSHPTAEKPPVKK